MSGIIGHTMYAILAGKAASARKLAIAPLIHQHSASYLCGAYLGCDIQTLPEAICVDTAEPVGYGTVPLQKSPLTGGKVRPWTLRCQDREYTPRDIHRAFYGRAHLVFGWSPSQRIHSVPWDHLADFCAATLEDTVNLYGPGERQLAYLFGWMAHIVSDSLIKSITPGVDLVLLDGKYTPSNRPIQDLITYHEIGIKELGLNWAAILTDLAETPIEEAQFHYMRVANPQGALADTFPGAWAPDQQPLLKLVLEQNRRYQRIRTARLLKKYELTKRVSGWECSPQLQHQAGGHSYREMIGLARRARFRHALWQIAERVANLFEDVIQRYPAFREQGNREVGSWEQFTEKWRKPE